MSARPPDDAPLSGLLRNPFKRRSKPQPEPEYVTAEDYWAHFTFPYEIPKPKGVMVRTWVTNSYAVDIYWPSWAAWRFAQGSPEYVIFRDYEPVYSHTVELSEGEIGTPAVSPMLPPFRHNVDTYRVPPTEKET